MPKIKNRKKIRNQFLLFLLFWVLSSAAIIYLAVDFTKVPITENKILKERLLVMQQDSMQKVLLLGVLDSLYYSVEPLESIDEPKKKDKALHEFEIQPINDTLVTAFSQRISRIKRYLIAREKFIMLLEKDLSENEWIKKYDDKNREYKTYKELNEKEIEGLKQDIVRLKELLK